MDFGVTLGRQLLASEHVLDLQALRYQPNSVGYLSAYLQDYGRSVLQRSRCREESGVFISAMRFCHPSPILVTIDARSTTILKNRVGFRSLRQDVGNALTVTDLG